MAALLSPFATGLEPCLRKGRGVLITRVLLRPTPPVAVFGQAAESLPWVPLCG